MLSIILADAELETIPQELWRSPAIRAASRKTGKKPGQLILDASLHHSALKDSADWKRRGRPDIVHFFLMLCLDSVLNQLGQLNIYVHTRNDLVIEPASDVRLPKNYNRFLGLMEQLFARGQVPAEGEPLVTLRRRLPLKRLVAELDPDEIIALSPDGDSERLDRLFSGMIDKNVACIVGGFSSGDFSSPVYELCTKKISIHPELLKVWTVTSEVLVSYELALRG